MTHTFTATLQQNGTSAIIVLPFDPGAVWGARTRYHITGQVAGIAVRGALIQIGAAYALKLGPAWLRDGHITLGRTVTVTLSLEGPQADALADDIRLALQAHPAAQAFFAQMPTFYRKKYLRWVDATKGKPAVRAQRIAEMITLLADGHRERP